eukprot:1160741-Pyramimonas_sp.AAC.1
MGLSQTHFPSNRVTRRLAAPPVMPAISFPTALSGKYGRSLSSVAALRAEAEALSNHRGGSRRRAVHQIVFCGG